VKEWRNFTSFFSNHGLPLVAELTEAKTAVNRFSTIFQEFMITPLD